ncbi:MAG: hypothetical protein DDT42_01821 [candidate division WS2 bacterium]|uniref:Uncharacterized protein n=1 Tax=Psychracetigena formicireducens TaxID=2986056 RepID=A0A9E2BI05_PSYF1|nr:hypothetical protein [Candidatus Psychracetigena formicireducens]MBT9145943.1 hypothetical protein [Candidatus Psychracetigena formicireducens]
MNPKVTIIILNWNGLEDIRYNNVNLNAYESLNGSYDES